MPKKAAKRSTKKASAPAAGARSEKGTRTASTPPPSPVVVPPPKTKLTKEELKKFKATLLGLRDQLSRQVGSMESTALNGESDVSVDHMADHGSETFDQDFTLSLIENEEQTIRDIDAALLRIQDGSYGLCEPCIEEPRKLCKPCPHIPKARLEAIPYTKLCVEYARIAERDREIEEAQDDEE